MIGVLAVTGFAFADEAPNPQMRSITQTIREN